jgi:hypothetical protein
MCPIYEIQCCLIASDFVVGRARSFKSEFLQSLETAWSDDLCQFKSLTWPSSQCDFEALEGIADLNSRHRKLKYLELSDCGIDASIGNALPAFETLANVSFTRMQVVEGYEVGVQLTRLMETLERAPLQHFKMELSGIKEPIGFIRSLFDHRSLKHIEVNDGFLTGFIDPEDASQVARTMLHADYLGITWYVRMYEIYCRYR